MNLALFRKLALLATTFCLLPASGLAQGEAPVQSLMEQRQSNIVIQQYDLSCGAAALATILRYQHGEAIDERRVAIGLISRQAYIANPNILRARHGFSLLDMKRYTEQLGYRGEALGSVSVENLVDLAPAIVPIRLHGYSHFVVFRGVFEGNVLLGDPAFGNRTLSQHQFVNAWIDYANFGHVAFTVRRRDGLIPPNQLAASARDFPILMPEPSKPETP